VRTANVLKATRQIADEALYRSSLGGGAGTDGPLPAATFTVMVNKGGSDVTGNGTDEAPYLTIAKAHAVAKTLPLSLSQFALVLIGPGTYNENVLVPAFTFDSGTDPGGLTVTVGTGVGNSIALDPNWTTVPPGPGTIGGAQAMATAGDVNIDYTGTPLFSNFQFGGPVFFGGSVTFTGDATNGGGGFISPDCVIGAPVLLHGITSFNATGALFAVGATVTLKSSATNPLFFEAVGGAFQDAVIVDATAGKNVTAIFETEVTGPLTLHDGGGGVTSYSATAGGIPPVVTLVGGAALPVNLTAANGLGYVPGVPGNWVGPAPTTVQQALDRIAANVGNAHPIP
jgi:hypothetical protein